MEKMKKIVLKQNSKLAFPYKGDLTDEIFNLITLDCAFMSKEIDVNNKLFVKTGEYKQPTKKSEAINKYTNVPINYWIVISNFLQDPKTKEILYVKKIDVLSEKAFFDKYHILQPDEAYLFEDVEIYENKEACNE